MYIYVYTEVVMIVCSVNIHLGGTHSHVWYASNCDISACYIIVYYIVRLLFIEHLLPLYKPKLFGIYKALSLRWYMTCPLNQRPLYRNLNTVC